MFGWTRPTPAAAGSSALCAVSPCVTVTMAFMALRDAPADPRGTLSPLTENANLMRAGTCPSFSSGGGGGGAGGGSAPPTSRMLEESKAIHVSRSSIIGLDPGTPSPLGCCIHSADSARSLCPAPFPGTEQSSRPVNSEEVRGGFLEGVGPGPS